MIAATGLGLVVVGAALAYLGGLVPRYIAAAELFGGALVVAGLITIGTQLAAFHF